MCDITLLKGHFIEKKCCPFYVEEQLIFFNSQKHNFWINFTFVISFFFVMPNRFFLFLNLNNFTYFHELTIVANFILCCFLVNYILYSLSSTLFFILVKNIEVSESTLIGFWNEHLLWFFYLNNVEISDTKKQKFFFVNFIFLPPPRHFL